MKRLSIPFDQSGFSSTHFLASATASVSFNKAVYEAERFE
jgi:hypothetical protein